MRQDGQFIEMNRNEFLDWLIKLKVNRKITHVQNHHTWNPNYSSGTDSIQLAKNMKTYHVKELGWNDIGQHITTVKNGLICIGRSFDKDPAGIMAHNTGGITIENIGNFDVGGDVMTEEHKLTIAFVNAALCYKFNLPINNETVVYHTWFGYLSDANKKTCPGTNFFGGNSKLNASNNFYPLINQQLINIKKQLIKEVVYMLFKDENQISPWALASVKRLKELGIVNGDNEGNFLPKSPITREQMCVVLDKILHLMGK